MSNIKVESLLTEMIFLLFGVFLVFFLLLLEIHKDAQFNDEDLWLCQLGCLQDLELIFFYFSFFLFINWSIVKFIRILKHTAY